MKSRQTVNKRRYTSRRASILVCVLVCMAVATALVTSTVQTALTARRAMRTQHHLRQTELLLDAGVQRAALQIQSTPGYSGETWKLSPNTLPGIETAQVKIDFVPTGGEVPGEVHVIARLSIAEHATVQRSYSFSVDPQLPSDKE